MSKQRLDKKTLLVSWGLPPALIGSSNIVANLAAQFEPEEMVLVGEKWITPNQQTEATEPGKPEVHYSGKQWPYRGRKYVRLITYPIVPWRIWRTFRKTKCKQIIAVFPDEFYMSAAWFVAKLTGATFYPYYHNTYVENRKGIKLTFAKWLQRKTFESAPVVFVMSDGMTEFLESKYPGVNFVSLVHTFNEPIQTSPVPPSPSDALRVAFMGSLNGSNSDAMSRINGILKTRNEIAFTTYSRAGKKEFGKLGIGGDQVTHTSVAYDEVTHALRQHDILFLPHGFEGVLNEVEYATIFPTRTIPYLLSGRPIIAHSPPNSFLTKWLRKNDCAEIVDVPTEDALVTAFEKLLKSPERQKQLVDNALKAVQQFKAENVANELRSILNGHSSEN